MLQGNKNKLSHRVRVRDNNERKRKVVLYFVLFVECSHLLIVPPPLLFLQFLQESEMAGSPLAPGEQPTYWRPRWWAKRGSTGHIQSVPQQIWLCPFVFKLSMNAFMLQRQSGKVATGVLQPTKLDLHLLPEHLQKIPVDPSELGSGGRNINWEFQPCSALVFSFFYFGFSFEISFVIRVK